MYKLGMEIQIMLQLINNQFQIIYIVEKKKLPKDYSSKAVLEMVRIISVNIFVKTIFQSGD